MTPKSHNDTSVTPDTLEDFAHSLRELRRDAGDATLVSLSAKTGISKSVISEALLGRKLPTERTVSKLVDALGGDREYWVRRRRALDGKAHSNPGKQITPEPNRRTLTIPQALLMALVTAAVTAGVTSSVIMHTQSASATEAAGEDLPLFVPAQNGVDPMLTECRLDSVIAASEPRMNNETQMQLMYSNKCQAVWGRITRYDGKSADNSISMQIYPEADPNSPRSQTREAKDVQSLYTPMLIEPDVEARICGTATVTVDGQPVELGPPLCI